MIENIKYTSNGTIVVSGRARYTGKLNLNEQYAEFVTSKGAEVIRFELNSIADMKRVRTGGVKASVTISLKDGQNISMDLERGLGSFEYINKHWTTKPKKVRSRADELSERSDRLGERVQKPKHHLIKRRHPNRSVWGDIGIYLMLLLVAFMMAFPLIFAVGSSLKPLDELFRFPPTVLPQHPTLDNYSDLIVTMGQSWVPFSRYLLNTVFITFAGTFCHLIIASMAAFVLAKYDFPGGKLFFGVVTTALMFSGYVTGIPNYVIMSKLDMIDTYWALLLPAFAAPIGLFMMKQFMESLPTALIEAAHIDGANELRVFWSIVMPNVKPAWLTVIIFSVQSLWNTSASTVIYSESKKTLVYALQQIQAGGIARTGQAAAVTVVVMIVPIIIFVLSQSQILETMASSGIKD